MARSQWPYGIADAEFREKRAKLTARFGKPAPDADVIWGCLVTRSLHQMARREWASYARTWLVMALALVDEGRDRRAAHQLLMFAYLFLNGPRDPPNSGYGPPEARLTDDVADILAWALTRQRYDLAKGHAAFERCVAPLVSPRMPLSLEGAWRIIARQLAELGWPPAPASPGDSRPDLPLTSPAPKPCL